MSFPPPFQHLLSKATTKKTCFSHSAFAKAAVVTLMPFVSFLGQDTRIRFSLEPSGGDPGFNQWKDAMKMVARLPEGVPVDFRKKVKMMLAFILALFRKQPFQASV